MNWHARWQRVRDAADRLAVLPPIDVVKYDGSYWVVDGHNRVASALYDGQQDIDANVVELVPPHTASSEPAGSMASAIEAYGDIQDALRRDAARTVQADDEST